MPRIPTHQYDDEWGDPDELEIEDDEPRNRRGQKIPRRAREQNRDWEEARKEHWRRRSRDDY